MTIMKVKDEAERMISPNILHCGEYNVRVTFCDRPDDWCSDPHCSFARCRTCHKILWDYPPTCAY